MRMKIIGLVLGGMTTGIIWGAISHLVGLESMSSDGIPMLTWTISATFFLMMVLTLEELLSRKAPAMAMVFGATFLVVGIAVGEIAKQLGWY